MRLIIIILIFIITSASCKKSWLEIIPQGQRVLTTVEDYRLFMNGAWLYNSSGAWGEPLLMGDDVAAEAVFFENTYVSREPLFRWADTLYQRSDMGSAPRFNLHTVTMYNLNKVINEVMNATDGTEAEKKALRAEALASRAWSTFDVANFYCKPYEEATASSDYGMPITTTADVTEKFFSRGTLKETYDFIIKDLQDALTDIPQKQLHVTRMSKPAVEAILGKVYMFMGRYEDALPYLNAAIEDVMANGQTKLYNYNETLAPDGMFMPIDPLSGPLGGPGKSPTDVTESVLFKVFNADLYQYGVTGVDGLVLSPMAQALYQLGDLRLTLYTALNPDFSENTAGRLRKYGVQFQRFGLQLSELYLLQAECKARLNDLPGAVSAVQILRENRMPVADAEVPSSIANDQNDLIRFIFDERTREFAMEGMRWFDMRRQSVDPVFAGISFTHYMYEADGDTTEFVLRQPQRLTLKWPVTVKDAHPEIPDNE